MSSRWLLLFAVLCHGCTLIAPLDDAATASTEEGGAGTDVASQADEDVEDVVNDDDDDVGADVALDVGYDAPAQCSGYSRCGGDANGEWELLEYCLDEDAAAEAWYAMADGATECVSVTGISSAIEGTFDVSSDTSVYVLAEGVIELKVDVDSLCLIQQEASAVVCDDLQTAFVSAGDLAYVLCDFAASSCNCAFGVEVASDFTESQVFMDALSAGDYCVQGDTLRFRVQTEFEAEGLVVARRR